MSFKNKLKFPDKLFKIVSECKSGCIRWSPEGDVVIFFFPLFQYEYLSNDSFFKTRNLSSFVRSLNIYGFEKQKNKVRSNTSGTYIYRNEYFLRDHPEYLHLIKRKTRKVKKNNLKTKWNKKKDEVVTECNYWEHCTPFVNISNSEKLSADKDQESGNDSSFNELCRSWAEMMIDVELSKGDLDAVVREGEKVIDFQTVGFYPEYSDEISKSSNVNPGHLSQTQKRAIIGKHESECQGVETDNLLQEMDESWSDWIQTVNLQNDDNASRIEEKDKEGETDVKILDYHENNHEIDNTKTSLDSPGPSEMMPFTSDGNLVQVSNNSSFQYLCIEVSFNPEDNRYFYKTTNCKGVMRARPASVYKEKAKVKTPQIH